MRAGFVAFTAALLPAGIAAADVLPPPTRPEWDDTPLPMPSDPTEVGVLLVTVAALVALFVWRARRVVA